MRHKPIGHSPKDANGVIYDVTYPDAATGDPDNPLLGWRLYRRAASAAPWVSLKLMRVTAGKTSANYWLAWHADAQRFSRSRECVRIPLALRDAVERVMRDVYPGMTETDIIGLMADCDAADAQSKAPGRDPALSDLLA